MLKENKFMDLSSYPFVIEENLRYCDTDRQGHVNNAVFSSLLESGRVRVFYNPLDPFTSLGFEFVIVNLNLNFKGELYWHKKVQIGSGVQKIGKSSVKIQQGIYQEGQLRADAESTIVLMDVEEKKSAELTESIREKLKKYLL